MIYNLTFFLMSAGVLLSVAFFTLMERKLMGLSHYRKGPNKLAMLGVSQPISDALKLLSKEFVKMSHTKVFMFMFGPSIAMMLMLLLWGTYSPHNCFISKSMVPMLVVLAIMSMSPHVFILMGWGSNTKYTIMGTLRAVAQVVSYEVCLIIIMLSVFYSMGTFNMEKMMTTQNGMWFMFMNMPMFMWWVLMSMAETNRTPFDHAESESELVSGFNIEYGGGMFALIFISEYGMIMFMGYLTSIIFLGNSYILLKTMFICMIFITSRCSYPRMRYDNLMMISWKICLPYSLCMLSMYI